MYQLKTDLLGLLCCPKCKSELVYNKEQNKLVCKKCKKEFLVKNGIAVMLIDSSGKEKEIIDENLKLHISESKFYEVQHTEIFNIFEQMRISSEIKRIKQELPGIPCALDLGAGTGNLTRHLHKNKFKVISSDLSYEMLNELDFPVIKVICEASNLPFKDNVFDLVTAYSVFHHLSNLEKSMKEIIRVSSKKSVLYFDHDAFIKQSNISKPSTLNRILEFAGFFIWALTEPKYLVQFFRYLFGERTKHLQYIKNVDFKLTDGNFVDTEKIIKLLKNNNFSVDVISHKSGSMVIAKAK